MVPSWRVPTFTDELRIGRPFVTVRSGSHPPYGPPAASSNASGFRSVTPHANPARVVGEQCGEVLGYGPAFGSCPAEERSLSARSICLSGDRPEGRVARHDGAGRRSEAPHH